MEYETTAERVLTIALHFLCFTQRLAKNCLFSKIQIGFSFLVPDHLGSPGEGPLYRYDDDDDEEMVGFSKVETVVSKYKSTNSLTHVPRANEDGDALDLGVETVHVLELLNQLAEVLALAHILEHVRLLLAADNLHIQMTVVCCAFHKLLDYTNTQQTHV